MSGFNFNSMGFGPRAKRPDSESGTTSAEAAKLLSRGLKIRLLILAIFIVILIMIGQVVVITYPNQYVAVRQFGEVVRITTSAGISFKVPFIQSASALPKDVQHYDMPISDVITQDKKTMVADSFVMWRVSDPLAFIRKAAGSVTQAQTFVGNNSYNALKNVIGRLPQTEIISGRDTLAQQIFRELDNALDEYGLEMVAIETKHLDLPDDNKNAVYDRMISERNNIAAQYTAEGDEEARKIRTETDKTVNIQTSNALAQAAEAIAEGERQYMEILGDAYSNAAKAEFYSFVRALDSAKNSLRGDNKTLILGIDSPIAQIFYND